MQLLLTALMYFTQIPVSRWVKSNPYRLKNYINCFALVGLIVGGLSSLVFFLSTFIFSVEISIVISIIASILITGALHEDGFADTCDGFGGGWNKTQILNIMKDSRLGTFGTLGLILILMLKFLALKSIPIYNIPLAIITGHSLSRGIAITLIYTHPYVRPIEENKAQNIIQVSKKGLIINLLFGILPLFFFCSYLVFIAIPIMYMVKLYLGAKFRHWIGGQTGDCVGAVQQVSEIVFYLCCVILWKFT